MKKIITTILILLIYSQIYSQKGIIGEWICDKITYSNGKELEINHQQFSTYISYSFDSKNMWISNNFTEKGTKFEYSIKDKLLKIGFREFNFYYSGNHLILNENGGDLSLYFLKLNDFIKKNNFYDSKSIIIENDTIFEQSLSINPVFKNKMSFSVFIRKNISSFSARSAETHNFESTFILTKENKIKEVKILSGISKSFDKQFLIALSKSEKYWYNTAGKNVLINQDFYFFKMGKYYSTKNAKIFSKHFKKAKDSYDKLDFTNAINSFNRALKIENENNRAIDLEKSELYLKLGISYLASNDFENACLTFNKIGGIYNFKVRNYLLKFCR